MAKLTELEKEVLEAVVTSDYQEDHSNPVNYPVWYLDASDVSMKPEQLSGAISSCSKKGYVTIVEDGNDSTIAITQLGYDTLMANK